MTLQSERDINSKFVTGLRHQALKTQHEFWGELGLSQPGGWRYENGTPIPQPTQKLIVLRHVLGDKFEETIEKGLNELRTLAGQMKPPTRSRMRSGGRT